MCGNHVWKEQRLPARYLTFSVPWLQLVQLAETMGFDASNTQDVPSDAPAGGGAKMIQNAELAEAKPLLKRLHTG